MPPERALITFLPAAVLLWGLLPTALARDHHGSDVIAPAPTRPTINSTSDPIATAPPSYFSLNHHQGLILAHIAISIISWFFVLPVAVILSVARSRLTIRWQWIFLFANAIGLVIAVAYNRSTPDLYQNNAHHKIGWTVTFMALGWSLIGILKFHTPSNNSDTRTARIGVPLYTRVNESRPPMIPTAYRWSRDSGQGTERNSASLFGSPRSMSETSDSLHFSEMREPYRPSPENHDNQEDWDHDEKQGFLSGSRVEGFINSKLSRGTLGRSWQVLQAIYIILERTLLVLGFLGIASGIITYGGILRGNNVFNGLAHFIKGGIFFGYGVLNLGRWMGCFADFGWAWNIKPHASMVPQWKAKLRSAEFVESAVIFTYGVSNVFLEHLGAWGGAWTAMDFEHVSITILFFGGGLMGMLVESSKIRSLLNTTSLQVHKASAVAYDQPPSEDANGWREPVQYAFPMNPMPGLVILLLGMMMSGHHQHSMVSTMLHAQWGGLFVGFALARAVTYILLYLSPPTSYLPSRPPSELVASFCLLSGGIMFILSNKDTVAALEYRGLDAMFVFTVTMGLTGVCMAWAVVVVAIKGWAVRRENDPGAIITPRPASTAA